MGTPIDLLTRRTNSYIFFSAISDWEQGKLTFDGCLFKIFFSLRNQYKEKGLTHHKDKGLFSSGCPISEYIDLKDDIIPVLPQSEDKLESQSLIIDAILWLEDAIAKTNFVLVSNPTNKPIPSMDNGTHSNNYDKK